MPVEECDVIDDVTSYFGLTHSSDSTCICDRNLNRLPKKKKKKKALTKVNIWLKVKIFKTDLSHSIFRVHFDFGICFFIQDLGIVQMVQFPESLLLHKS